MTTPLISVLMPVFNGAQHVEEAIRSVLDGDFQDVEIVCVNDGSTDDSLAILRALALEDDRVRVFTQENRGVAETCNQAAALARGRYFARLDHDDIALPQRLSRQLAHIEATGADIVSCAHENFGSETGWRLERWARHDDIALTLLVRCPVLHSTIFCRAEVMQTHHYDRAYELAEDFELWSRLVFAGKVFAGIPDVLVRYRWHDDQVSQRHRSRQRVVVESILARNRAWFGAPAVIFSPDARVTAYSRAVIALAFSLGRRGIFPSRHGWRHVLSGTGCVSAWLGRLLRRTAIEAGWLVMLLHRATGSPRAHGRWHGGRSGGMQAG